MRRVEQCSRFEEFDAPGIVAPFGCRHTIAANSVHRRIDARKDGRMRGPGDGWDDTDNPLRPLALPHELPQVWNLQSQTVAFLQVALIQTVNRDDQQRLARVDAKEKRRGEKCCAR